MYKYKPDILALNITVIKSRIIAGISLYKQGNSATTSCIRILK